MSCQDKQSDPSYPVRLYKERGRGTPSKFAYLNLWVGGRVCACACVCTLVPGSPGTTKNSRIIGGPSTKVVYVIMSNTHGNHVVITKRLIQCVSPIPKGKPCLVYGVNPGVRIGRFHPEPVSRPPNRFGGAFHAQTPDGQIWNPRAPDG
jgi:hypothetical protein